MERVRRIELRLSDRRSDAQPMGHTRKNLERTEIIEISSRGWRPRAQPIYHARTNPIFNCQRTNQAVHTLRPSCFQREASPPLLQCREQKQKGQPLAMAALLETGMLFQ